jgi:hypothetical protein
MVHNQLKINIMKLMYSLMCLSLLFLGCKDANQKTSSDDENQAMNVDNLFQKNSETVMANLNGWQNENLDYSMYSKDFVMLDTGFGAEKDSISLNEMMENDKMLWKKYDFKLLSNPPVLLPGVNSETKKVDGSVRHYSDWEVTLVATDSMPAKTGVIRMYESFDFDENGKILYQQAYADFTGLMMYLNTKDDMQKK